MNLTKPTGSLINNLYANSRYPEPTVGMGATRLSWTDRSPYTVVKVLGPKKIVVVSDRATRTDNHGMSESQSYTFETPSEGDEDYSETVLTLRPNGRWVAKGDSQKGTPFAIGYRNKYHDFSF